MSIFSKLLGRSGGGGESEAPADYFIKIDPLPPGDAGGDGDPDRPLVVGPVPNAESVGGAQTETIGAGRTENVANPAVEDEVPVAFEDGGPDGTAAAQDDPASSLAQGMGFVFAESEAEQTDGVGVDGGPAALEIPAWHESVLLGDVAAAKPETGDEVLVAFEHGDVRADPDGGGEAPGDPFAVKIEQVVPPGDPGSESAMMENLTINFAKFEVPQPSALPGEDVVPPGDLAAGADVSESPGDYFLKIDQPPGDDALKEGGIVAATHKLVGSSSPPGDAGQRDGVETDGEAPGDLAAGPEVSESQFNSYLKVDLPPDPGAVPDPGVSTGEGPAPLDDGSIPTETLSLNFDKVTWKSAPGGPGANELSMDDTAGGEAADGGGVDMNIGVGESLGPGPGFRGGVAVGAGDVGDGGGAPTGEDLLVAGTTTLEGPVGDGGPGANDLSTDAGAASGSNVEWFSEQYSQSAPSISEIVVTKTTDSTSPLLMEDDDDGSTLESLAVQEPGAIGGAIGGIGAEGDDDIPDLDGLDLDDDGDIDL